MELIVAVMSAAPRAVDMKWSQDGDNKNCNADEFMHLPKRSVLMGIGGGILFREGCVVCVGNETSGRATVVGGATVVCGVAMAGRATGCVVVCLRKWAAVEKEVPG